MESKTVQIIGLTAIIIAFAHIGQLLIAGKKYIIEAGQSSWTPQWIAKVLIVILLLALIFLIYRTIMIYVNFKKPAQSDKVILMTAIIVALSLFGQLLIQLRSFTLEYRQLDPNLTDIILRITLEVIFIAVLILGYKTMKMYIAWHKLKK